ncbi:outer membrane lipoprotein-sorting protein [Desulfobacula sp.]|uniref:outer membrane lipoprotein-sorting protein n=1 Tax=Desulfobacula sp. TaxID=2593537 RepID=UPI0025BB2274|nr:outer membrane lipoprotein-sorting protein [Desulfobacula sp.]MBC2702997.1 outer membrane lipoprotein-sorting protein [Desulfobacula sp.]
MKKVVLIIGILFFAVDSQARMTAETIVKKAFDYWRGEASESTITMTIHRPDWERVVTIKAWTRGESDSLFVITNPAKDRGNGTLKVGKGMWMYNPKVNRVIKLPPSMMSQGWHGSDFSNNDLAKTDSLIKDYIHTLEDTKIDQGKKVYSIKSIPKPEAPVIWGMIKLTIREDNILLSEVFFDEDLQAVKRMTAWDIQMTGDKLFPLKWKMQKSDAIDEYTRFVYEKISFKKNLSKRIFTRTYLKNPGL